MTDTQQQPASQQPAYNPYPVPQRDYPEQRFAPAPQQPAEAPKKRNVVGIVALVLSALGFVFACIPGALLVGWFLLPVSFILGIVAVCLKNRRKWQALTAIIVSVVGTITGFIVFFALMASALTDSGLTVGDSTDVAGEQSQSAPAAQAPVAEEAAADEAAAGTRENPLPFGTPISTDDWDVTLAAFDPNGNAAVAAGNMFNDAPAAGSQYVVLDLAATYKGAGEGSSMMVEVDYVTADGTVVSTWDSVVAGVDPVFGQASLYAGATDTGKLVFQVPSTLDGLIRVTPGMLSTEEIFFTLP